VGWFDDIIGGFESGIGASFLILDNWFGDFNPVTAAQDTAHAIVSLGKDVLQGITNFAALIAGAIISIGETLWNVAQEVIETILSVMNQVMTTLVSTLLSIFNFLVDFVNRVYLGFKMGIDAMSAEIETHVAQFALGVTDKAGKLLGMNTAMTILKHGAETGTFTFNTVKQAAFGGITTYLFGELIKGLIQ
jgi:phage-related protein